MVHIRSSKGFTLVEVLVVSPIIILFIGVFIGLLVTLTGESLVTRERNVSVYNTQSALGEIKADINQSIGFLSSTGPLDTPQGKNDATQAFSDTTTSLPDSLIIKKSATTKNPADPAREVIYTGTTPCDPKNTIYAYYTIYFVAADTDTSGNALYRRTVLPNGTKCATPWQRGSCKRGVTGALCQRADEKIVSNVTAMEVKYYSNTGVSRDDNAESTADVSVSISTSKQVAGSSINFSSSIRATTLNIQ